jgi:hypothetical protein
VLAVLHVSVIFEKAENSASHEEMGMRGVIDLDLVKTLVPPVDTILAVDHDITVRGSGRRDFTAAVP